MKATVLVFSALLMFVVAGCDTIYGVSRSGSTQVHPGPGEIETALAAVPGVTRVTKEFVSPVRYFSLYEGIRKTPGYYQFLISGVDVSCVLTIGEEKGKEVRLYSYRMHVPLSQAERVKVEAFMDRVYVGLVARFPELPPPSTLKNER